MIFGIIISLVVLFVGYVLRLFLSRFVNRSFDEVTPYLRADDETVLSELLDETREEHLALNLGDRMFRKEQFRRMRLCHEHIGRRGHNATVLQEWADTEVRRSRYIRDKEIATAAQALVESCAKFRIGCSTIQMYLFLWRLKLHILPNGQVPYISLLRTVDTFDVFKTYDQVRQAALTLAALCGGDQHRILEQAFQ